MLPLKRRLLRERKLASHEEYHYPTGKGINPLELDYLDLENLLKESDSDVIRTLARSGLGGLYAEEVLLRAGLDKKKPSMDLDEGSAADIQLHPEYIPAPEGPGPAPPDHPGG